MLAHRYNPITHDYVSSSEDFGNPPANSSYVLLPPRPWDRQWPRFNGVVWELIEDHRERKAPAFANEDAQEATDFWMPGDNYNSPARKVFQPGPLPEGALLDRPDKPLSVLKQEKAEEIGRAYEAAIAASLTMPLDNPSAQDVALGAALFAADDAEGLAFVQTQHLARRTELLDLLDVAQSTEEVEAIGASYAV